MYISIQTKFNLTFIGNYCPSKNLSKIKNVSNLNLFGFEWTMG